MVEGTAITAVEEVGDGGLVVHGADGFRREADLVLVSVGVGPATRLAVEAGAEMGARGAIRVNSRMETSLPFVLAAGDCVETWHRVLDRPVYLPLGTTSHKQGRVAGENAVGGSAEFQGSLGTQVAAIGARLTAAAQGSRERRATATRLHRLA